MRREALDEAIRAELRDQHMWLEKARQCGDRIADLLDLRARIEDGSGVAEAPGEEPEGKEAQGC